MIQITVSNYYVIVLYQHEVVDHRSQTQLQVDTQIKWHSTCRDQLAALDILS